MIDLEQLDMTPRSVRPLDQQEERESRRLWDPVTSNMLAKNWSEATKQKQSIEQVCVGISHASALYKTYTVSCVPPQRQRDLAAERKQKGVEYVDM